MTTLETILILILWISYGVFTAFQISKDAFDMDNNDISGLYIVSILFSPILLIIRAIIGIFKSNIFRNI